MFDHIFFLNLLKKFLKNVFLGRVAFLMDLWLSCHLKLASTSASASFIEEERYFSALLDSWDDDGLPNFQLADEIPQLSSST